MNSKSTAPTIPLFSTTPHRPPSSVKLSPPPLKQHRPPRHIAVPLTQDDDDAMEGVSSLLSIMHGHTLSTPHSSSSCHLSNILVPSLAENAEDSMQDRCMEEDEADMEVAMISSISREAAPSSQRAVQLKFRPSGACTLPFFPQDEDFNKSSSLPQKERFALLPKINLYKEKY